MFTMVMIHIYYGFYLLGIDIVLKACQHSIECHLCRIWNEREYRVAMIIVNSLQDWGCQLLSQFLSFVVDILV